MTAAQDALERAARARRLLVALDFDGTLSPFVANPMDARMQPDARRAIEALAAAPETIVALVSGRSLGDLRVISEHDDSSAILLAGSHGVEYWDPTDGRTVPQVEASDARVLEAILAEVHDRLDQLPGIRIESKAFGFGVHSRGADDAVAADSVRIADEIVATRAPGWRRRLGHSVVEYAFRDEGKDAAIATLRAKTAADAVVFAGDDVTDEDAIAALGAGDVGIRLGAGETAADVRLDGIGELAAWLAELARLRAAGMPSDGPASDATRE